MIRLMLGKCEKRLKSIKTNSIDSIVTDPPYGLKFMGKAWDHGVPSTEVWKEIYRILKPGGFLLSFAGTRTYHRMAVNIENAGFEIRDMIAWVYGSGFPKSLNIGKAVDKKQGNKREASNNSTFCPDFPEACKGHPKANNSLGGGVMRHTRATKGNSEWEGWGTALKPAHEPIVVARKPLSEKTVAENVLKYGTGGINIDGCRVEAEKHDDYGRSNSNSKGTVNAHNGFEGRAFKNKEHSGEYASSLGRFPANFIHDGSEEVVDLFPESKSGAMKKGEFKGITYGGDRKAFSLEQAIKASSGSASRFFYVAKASKSERTEQGQIENSHPTVKPLALMRYLVRLVTPVGGWICDPFMGSGTTGKASRLEGFNFIGVEDERESYEIAKQRIKITVKKT